MNLLFLNIFSIDKKIENHILYRNFIFLYSMKIKESILTVLKGIAMGGADVIPWVSWGTIAFIVGIYERLITAIKNIFPNIKLLFQGNFKTFRKNIDGTFLLCIILGIGISIFSLAHLMTYLLDTYKILVWSFFFGLVLISSFFIGKQVKRTRKTIFFCLLFAVISFFITSPENTPLVQEPTWRYLFLCGAVAICAMILPWISGSFILVLLGQYEYVLTAIKSLNVPVIALFWAGAVVWILLFSNIVSRLFKKWKILTLSSLCGFVLGSLNKIRPRKETLHVDGIEDGLVAQNVVPRNYTWDSQLFYAILWMIIGITLVLSIEWIAKKMKKSD